jgi:hypothetical protein
MRLHEIGEAVAQDAFAIEEKDGLPAGPGDRARRHANKSITCLPAVDAHRRRISQDLNHHAAETKFIAGARPVRTRKRKSTAPIA